MLLRNAVACIFLVVWSSSSNATFHGHRNSSLHLVVNSAGKNSSGEVSTPVATTPPRSPQGQEVVIGARLWRYDRVYPLLDGLFQDVVSSQVTQLLLNNNAANASSLDALTQSFSLQAGYNQLAGVQNSVASQMAVANLGYQSTLAQQSQSILQQQLAAQQQLAQATQDQSDATSKNDSVAEAAATKKIQSLNNTISSLAAQMALVKNPSTPFSPSPASGTIANPTPTFTSAIPSSVLSAGTVTGGPTFPPTKQLDNQVDLLWSRLARVVGTMAQPDSANPDDRLFLIEFNTATFPKQNHEQHLLDTTYDLACSDQTDPESQPTVVDVFPRVAALNITDTRYKDQGFNLGAVTAFFGFGVNGSYNREHLRMTQLLGQASYITGYGIGQSHFGWKFGITLGDKIISSDIKKTFALIRVPFKCSKPVVSFDKVWWGKLKHTPKSDDSESSAVSAQVAPSFLAMDQTMADQSSHSTQPSLESIDFNRTVYDPTKYSATNPVPVSLVLHFSENLDPQILVYANGVLVKRARDTFGRAVSSTNTPGLLEASSLAAVNTWLPTSSKSLIVNLDGGQFGQTFPTIMIVPPSQPTISVGPNLVTSNTDITVSGKQFRCRQFPCPLPSLAYKQTSFVRITAARWLPAANDTYRVIFTTKGNPQPLSISSSTPSSVQLVTGSEDQAWGTNAEVYATLEDDSTDGNSKQVKLQCDTTASSGERLVCDIGSDVAKSIARLNFGDVKSSYSGNIADKNDPPKVYSLDTGSALPEGIVLDSSGSLSGTPKSRGSTKFTITATDKTGAGVTKREYLGTVGPNDALLQPTGHIRFHILDVAHSGGPIEGWTELAKCDGADCHKPTIWSVGNPLWNDGSNGWDLTIQAVNVDVNKSHNVSLQLRSGNRALPLEDKTNSGIFSAVYQINSKDINNWYDSIEMTVDGSEAKLKLLNIHSLISPVVSYISPDSTLWSGQNLTNLFRFLEIGASTKGIQITCPVITACTVNGGAKAMPKQTGILYLASSENPNAKDFVELALMKLNSNGTVSPISYQPPTTDKPASTQPVGSAQASTATPPTLTPDTTTPSATPTITTPTSPIAKQSRNAAISIQ